MTRYIETTTIDEAWQRLLALLLDRPVIGSRDGECRELEGVHVVLDGSQEQLLLNPGRKLSASYACAETLWYLSGERKINRIVAYAPSYERFSDAKTGEAYGAYGFRVRKQYGDLISVVTSMLRETPGSRQAVIPIFQPVDLLQAEVGDCPDIPCTISWQFTVRDGKLNMAANMRSNDAWLGVGYDIWCNTFFQKLIAGRLGLTAGEYRHNAESYHLYTRNYDSATKCLESYDCSRHCRSIASYELRPGDLSKALSMEKEIRTRKVQPVFIGAYLPSILEDMLICCGRKFGLCQQLEPRSVALRRALAL